MRLYRGAIDLYRAKADYAFAYTQVAVRAGETPVALRGYTILPEGPQRVMETAAELAAVVDGLTAAPPTQLDVPWEELHEAFMASAEAEATAEGSFIGTPKRKASKPVVRPTEGSNSWGGRKGVGSLKIDQNKQKGEKAAAGGESSAGKECTSRVYCEQPMQHVFQENAKTNLTNGQAGI
jgi:hypothetical protein